MHDDGDSFFDDDCNNTNDLNNVLGCWSSPDCLAINMIEEHEEDDDDTPATKPSSGHTLQPTAMMVMLLGVLLHFANV